MRLHHRCFHANLEFEGAALKLLITLEDHLTRCADGSFYGRGPIGYEVWAKYTEFFEEIMLLARVHAGKEGRSGAQRVDGPAVIVHELPDYTGPAQYLRSFPRLRSRVREAIASSDAYLLRIPGLVGRLAWREIRREKKPFSVEIMGDPWDSLGPGSIKAALRPLYRRMLTRDTRFMCAQANAVLYWSQEALQRRYPPGDSAFTVVSPEVILSQGFATPDKLRERFLRIEELCRPGGRNGNVMRLGFIGGLEHMYKGLDILLPALSLCMQRGLNLKVILVGEGRYRRSMETLATSLCLSDQVVFIGQLEFGKPIFDFLDSIDLFVMPSRQEGMPRALVEAMSRGCPCIAFAVGGIPEILAREDIVPAGNKKALADKIFEVARNLERMKQMSQRNTERAKSFSPEVLLNTRRAFLRHIGRHFSN